MTFDQKRYELEVIRPLRRGGGALPDDLLLRYGMPYALSGSKLRKHLQAVRAYWTTKSGGVGNLAQLCQRLLTADDELAASHDLNDSEFWTEVQADNNSRLEDLIRDLVEDLQRQYRVGPTREQLENLPSRYVELSYSQRLTALETAGLRVVTPLDTSADGGITQVQLRELDEKIMQYGATSVVDLLIPKVPKPFSLIDGFHAANRPTLKLDRDLVEKVHRETQAAGNSSAQQARALAVRTIRHALKRGATLESLALKHLMLQIEGMLRHGEAFAIRHAKNAGLTPVEAELIVIELSSQPQVSVDDVAQLVDSGLLRQAQSEMAKVASDAAGRSELARRISALTAEVDELVAQARDATRNDAERLLRKAMTLASDDVTVAQMWAEMPPTPAVDVSASMVGTGPGVRVRLTWRRPLAQGRPLCYRVVRTVDGPARRFDDGEFVGETAQYELVDTDPDVGPAVTYTVFAAGAVDSSTDQSDPGRWSSGTAARVSVMPPVSKPKVLPTVNEKSGEVTTIKLHWVGHPQLDRVAVNRTCIKGSDSSRDVRYFSANHGGLADTDVAPNCEYRYQIVAQYRDKHGQRYSAAAVSALANTDNTGGALLQWSLQTTGEDETLVRLTWPESRGKVQFLECAQDPGYQVGDQLPVEELARIGRLISGPQSVKGSQVTMEALYSPERSHYLPVTLTGDTAIVGQLQRLSLLSKVTDLVVDRLGEQLVVSWIWPESIHFVEVTVRHGAAQTHRVSRTQYSRDGGFRCEVPQFGSPVALEVAVRSLRETGSMTDYSGYSRVELPIDPTKIRYWVTRSSAQGMMRSWLGRSRSWQVRVEGVPTPCPTLDLVIVAKPGTVSPVRMNKTEVIKQVPLGLVLDGKPHDFNVPESVGNKYCLRCFLVPSETPEALRDLGIESDDNTDPMKDLVLIDPPQKTLKVGLCSRLHAPSVIATSTVTSWRFSVVEMANLASKNASAK